jgi:hypothetical protein
LGASLPPCLPSPVPAAEDCGPWFGNLLREVHERSQGQAAEQEKHPMPPIALSSVRNEIVPTKLAADPQTPLTVHGQAITRVI